MREAAKRILAYQRTPQIIVCHDAGTIPEEFLLSSSYDEKAFLHATLQTGMDQLFVSLLQAVHAAGVTPRLHTSFVNVHSRPVQIRSQFGDVYLPLADDAKTREYLLNEYALEYHTQLTQTITKTQARFGEAQVILLALLPRFVNGMYVSEKIIGTSDTPFSCPEYLVKWTNQFSISTVVGIHPNVFVTDQSYADSLKQLGALKQVSLVQR